MQCSVCKLEAECRIRTDNGGYGPVDVQTCQICHERELAEVRKECKRLGGRPWVKAWSKLTTQGAYSKVC